MVIEEDDCETDAGICADEKLADTGSDSRKYG